MGTRKYARRVRRRLAGLQFRLTLKGVNRAIKGVENHLTEVVIGGAPQAIWVGAPGQPYFAID